MSILSQRACVRLAAAALPVLLACGTALAQGTVRLVHAFAPGSIYDQGARRLASEIERASNGRFKVGVSSEHVSAKDAIEQVRRGAVDLAIVPTATLAASMPELRLFELPFLFEDERHVERFHASEPGRKLLQSLGSQGLIGLAFWNGPPRAIASRKPIVAPRDVRGMKVAEANPSSSAAHALQSLGASTPSLGFAEVFTAMQTGVVDAVDTTVPQLDRVKVPDTVKYVSVTGHAFNGYVVVASPKRFREPGDEKLLQFAAAKVTPEVNAAVAKEARVAIDSLREHGVQVTTFSAAQRELWRKEVQPTWAEYADTPQRKELVAQAERRPASANGHPPGPPIAAMPPAPGHPAMPAPPPPPAPPLPAPPPPPPPPPAGPIAAGPQLFPYHPTWNSWFNPRRTPLDPSPITKPLEEHVAYWLQFALSMTDLSVLPGVAGSPVSEEAGRIIERIPDQAMFKVAVLAGDEDAIHVPDQYRSVDLVVDATKYRAWRDTRRNGWKPVPAVSTRELISEAVVGQVSIPFDILKRGRHEVGLVVISPDGIPVDAVTVVVCTEAPCAQSRSQAARLPPKDALASDFVLWLHETTTEDVFLTRRQSVYAVLASKDGAGGSMQLLSWKLWTTMDGLVDAAGHVRNVMADLSNSDEIKEQGAALGMWIFQPTVPPPHTDARGVAVAAEARRRLGAAIARTDEAHPPNLVVRMTSTSAAREGAWSFYVLPFNVMAFAPEPDREPVFLGKSFIVSIAMPMQYSLRQLDCPEEWHISYPSGLTTSPDDALNKAVDRTKLEFQQWPDARQVVAEPEDLSDQKGFAHWLRDTVRDDQRKTTVFGFLGHHDAGTLFFNKSKGVFTVAQLQRQFKEPSVAILDACDVAMQNVTSGSFIGRLMNVGVTTVVATTSKISGPVAAAYLACLRRVLQSKTSLSVGEANYYVTRCMWGGNDAASWDTNYKFAHSSLRYQIFGNPYVKLCYPARANP